MPYDVFWHDDNDMVEVYVKAFRRKQDLDNYQLWLAGAYQCNAVSVAVGNAFRKKGAKAIDYMKEPIEINPKPDKISDAEKLYNKFKPVMAAFNARRQRKG